MPPTISSSDRAGVGVAVAVAREQPRRGQHRQRHRRHEAGRQPLRALLAEREDAAHVGHRDVDDRRRHDRRDRADHHRQQHPPAVVRSVAPLQRLERMGRRDHEAGRARRARRAAGLHCRPPIPRVARLGACGPSSPGPPRGMRRRRGHSSHAGCAMPELDSLKADLALALRAAAHHGLAEGVCNHFSVALPGEPARYLINPRGLHWSEVRRRRHRAGRRARRACSPAGTAVEPTAMFIHARDPPRSPAMPCVLHTHMPYATALTLTADRRARHRAVARTRCASTAASRSTPTTTASRSMRARASASRARCRARTSPSSATTASIVCGPRIAHAYDDLYYLERACMLQVLAHRPGRPLVPVDAALASAGRAPDAGRARPVGAVLRSAAAHAAGTGTLTRRLSCRTQSGIHAFEGAAGLRVEPATTIFRSPRTAATSGTRRTRPACSSARRSRAARSKLADRSRRP